MPTLAAAGLWFFPFLVSSLVYYHITSNDPEQKINNRKNLFYEYDFIVVGGGSAGSVVASRLSENLNWKVLLLEAGGDETEISDVPALAAYLQLGTLDWKYKTEHQPSRACLGMVNGRCNWPRGKVIGGSSVLNYMLYVRGNRKDYDNWAKQGNYGWDFKTVLHYFMKSEDNRNPYLAATDYHGTGGKLTVQESPWRTPLSTSFVEAGVEMGFENRDGNGESQTGFMIPQGTIRRGSRCSTAKAFLRPVRRRPNLHIALHSHVLKVLIDPSSKRAYAVKFRRYGKIWTVNARREIIVSGGAINTPQILMLSGVGPAWHLQHLGIPVIQDLPVGENLMDHYGSGSLAFTVDHPISLVQPRYESIPSVLKYVMFGTGPLTVLGGVEGLAWVPSIYSNRSIDYPDIEIHFASGTPASDGGRQLRKVFGMSDRMWESYRSLSFQDGFSFLPMLMRPRSRGTIRLRSKNPYHKPLIHAGYFTHPQDLRIMVDAMKFVFALSQTNAFKKFGARPHLTKMPGCEHHTIFSDEYFACMCQHFTSTVYHYSGTAKMGPPTDPRAVVDPELRVYGVSGLRVIDASIMPDIPSGNTNAPAIMVGEKGADLIKAYWKRKSSRRFFASLNTVSRGGEEEEGAHRRKDDDIFSSIVNENNQNHINAIKSHEDWAKKLVANYVQYENQTFI